MWCSIHQWGQTTLASLTSATFNTCFSHVFSNGTKLPPSSDPPSFKGPNAFDECVVLQQGTHGIVGQEREEKVCWQVCLCLFPCLAYGTLWWGTHNHGKGQLSRLPVIVHPDVLNVVSKLKRLSGGGQRGGKKGKKNKEHAELVNI